MNTINPTPPFPLLLETDGSYSEVRPKNGTDFQLKELYSHLNCELIEIARSQASGSVGAARRNYILIIDEEGKLKSKPHNPIASEWYSSPTDIIVGPAILCHSDYLR